MQEGHNYLICTMMYSYKKKEGTMITLIFLISYFVTGIYICLLHCSFYIPSTSASNVPTHESLRCGVYLTLPGWVWVMVVLPTMGCNSFLYIFIIGHGSPERCLMG